MFCSFTHYDTFKAEFIKQFSGNVKVGALNPLCALVRSYQKSALSLPASKALKNASNFKLELAQQLEGSAWVGEDEKLTLKDCVSLFGYFRFLSLLHPKTLEEAENVPFTPQDTLTAFSRQFRDSYDLSSIHPLATNSVSEDDRSRPQQCQHRKLT